MSTVIIYVLCGAAFHITLITDQGTLMYKPSAAAYIDIIKRTEGKHQVTKANLDNVLEGTCT